MSMTPDEEQRVMSQLIQHAFTTGFAHGVIWSSKQSGVSVFQAEKIKKRLPLAIIEQFNEYVESLSKPIKKGSKND